MEAIFKINSENFTEDLIIKIKQLFSKNSYFEIRVIETEDETDYLLSSVQNKETLLKSIKEMEEGKMVKN